LQYISCFPRDYKGVDEDVVVGVDEGFDEYVDEDVGDEEQPVEEMVMDADVVPPVEGDAQGGASLP
jgi:hypothetical protein